MRVTLIHNPAAGTTEQRERDELIALLARAGHEVRYQSCTEEDWRKALKAPADLIAVAGGDGTFGRVAKTLGRRAVPVTLLPAGTANNIARAMGIDERPYEALVRGWSGARRVPLDLAVARGPWGKRVLVEGMGAGLLACAIPAVDASRAVDDMPRADAKVAYILGLLKERLERAGAIEVQAELDGRNVSGEYLLFEAMLMPYVGPNLFLGPDCVPGDGLFDVVLARTQDRDRLREDLESWRRGSPRIAVLGSQRGRRLRLQWSGYALHLDDEVWPPQGGGRGLVELEVAEQRVEFLVPA